MNDTDLPFLPDDADAARPEDLARRQLPPPPQPMVLSAEAKVWPGEDPNAAPFHYIGQFIHAADLPAYCEQYYYGSTPPSYWVWHHTVDPDTKKAPYYSTPNKQWDRNEEGMTLEQKIQKRKPQLDNIMWFYRNSKGWEVGPHWFVDDLPGAWAFTPMYYIGIHANEGNSYTENGKTRYSIGCEVVGYYDTVVWPPDVRDNAGWLCACVKAALHFQNVYTAAGQDRPDLHDPQLSGHRDYTTEKSCPGRAITNEFFVQAAVDGWANYQAGIVPGPTPTDPLRAKQIGGPNNTKFYCSVKTHDFYMQKVGSRDGLWDFGYALADEYTAIDSIGQACQIMPFERGVLKTTQTEGARPTLLSEAVEMEWMRL